ncbi:MFS transporter [Paraburkholderia caballeronis]|uniref:Predicted arabinose efflux permease, MFS family n=1 Tax=Paraburkholderia caballeronis TaxID=416943 RepID=A0A1H7S196_9BURK|nr:MFS transporter [Paraburkholderia caballeronis]PXW22806.1 putative MFS family arabinose efflux permease [Paraburkholderia caballeronis]PXW97191.1 putative MFS family arabinose efflux permease [Paraburkholderia caballeronis]RAJ93711.1 putative MFS family arabinose efflux permease [Paraburkholderia caballeronis]TDV39131.1 putative MFS family arabinose efflux permease [Paraburkholderia caballeronis]SED62520.1 Predicted arabinose efflux permease, MFS family [Paraburkholderia caballeronis]
MLTESHSTAHAPAPESGGETTLRQWLSVGAVAIGAFAFVTTEFLPVGLLPHIARELDVSPGTAGLMVTTPGIAAAISAPALLIKAGRMDRRYVFLLLTGLLLVSNLMSAFAPNFTVMLCGRALLGAALGGFWTLATAAAGRLVRLHDAPRAMAMILTGVTCATVIGVPLGTFIAGFSSWRFSFLATGVLVAVAFVAQLLLVPSLPSSAALRFRDLVAVMQRPHPRKSMLMVALVFGAHFACYTYITPFLLHNANLSMSTITWLLLGFGVIGFFSNFAVSATVVRNLKASVVVMVCVLLLALLSMSVARHSTLAVSAVVLAWGISFGAIPLCFSVWIQRATPDQPEAGSALFVSVIQIAIALGSSVGGVIVDRLGIPADFMLGSVLALLGLGLLASFGAEAATVRGGERLACEGAVE